MGWLALGSPLRSTLYIQKFMSLSLHLELADCLIHKIGHENKSFSSLAPLNVWFRVADRSTNHVVPLKNSLLSAHFKGVRKGTLIDDSARREENDIRRRFLSDEGAAFTLLFLFENGHGLLSSLLAARRSFLPEGYHHEGVLAHRSLQVQT